MTTNYRTWTPRARAGARGALAVVAALALGGCAPDAVTEQGEAIHTVYTVFMYAAAVVFVVVSSLIVWSIVRYRRKDDRLPKQTHGSTRLELTWTILPTLLVAFLIVVTIRGQEQALDEAPDPPLQVTVTGFQWSWQFDYDPGGVQVIGTPEEPPELVVPAGVPIRFRIQSADVVHSFYLPRALFKRQAIPGSTTHFDLTFDELGTFPGACTQFCGVAHADMRFTVRVVPQGEFQRWLADRQAGDGTT